MSLATTISMAGAAASSSAFLSSPSRPSPSSTPFILQHHRQLNHGHGGSVSHNHRILFPRRPLQLPLSVSSTTTYTGSGEVLEVSGIKERSRKWQWEDRYSINYFVQSPLSADSGRRRPPLVLVHGFGASIPHWRRNITTLAQDHTVYAIDLLGFGASDKPAGFMYTMETWAGLLLDFLNEVVQEPAVLIGNSVGSLACVISAAGGMNNKAIVDDWRIKLLIPVLWLIDFLLKQKPIASALFERVKQRENLRNVLLSVYGCKESVDDTLVEIIKEPADGEGALDAFVSIVTGPPGPSPVKLMPKITIPVLVLWGDQDPFTPLDGPVGRYFTSLPSSCRNVTLSVLSGVGHCPHDDRPALVHEKLLPWLSDLPAA